LALAIALSSKILVTAPNLVKTSGSVRGVERVNSGFSFFVTVPEKYPNPVQFEGGVETNTPTAYT
jgi:hypothetical protein